MLMDDVFGAGGRFCEGRGQAGVLDDGSGADGVQGLDGCRGEDWIALVEAKSVGD